MGEKVKVFMNHLLSQPVVLQKTRQNCTSQYFVLSIDSSDMYRVLSRVRFYDLFKSSGNFHFAYYMPNTFLFQWNESRCWDSIRIIFSERKKKNNYSFVEIDYELRFTWLAKQMQTKREGDNKIVCFFLYLFETKKKATIEETACFERRWWKFCKQIAKYTQARCRATSTVIST